jgi:hypothetical protein
MTSTKDPNASRPRVPRSFAAAKALGWAFLACGAVLFAPPSLRAQQAGQVPKAAATPRTAAERAADSAACARIINYAFQHPEVLQKSEELRASGKTKELSALPDTVRASVAAAIAQGQADSLKAIARRTLDPQKSGSFDGLIDFVTAFPDSVRRAVATLVASGRPMTCSS